MSKIDAEEDAMIAKLRVVACSLIFSCFAIAQNYETLGRNIVEDLFAHQFQRVASQFDARWAQAMPEEKLPEYVNMLSNLGGKFQNISGVRLEESQGNHIVYVSCRFEKRILYITVSFNSRNQICVLTASPADPLQRPFNDKADAKADIKKAVEEAAFDNIRVLIAWGANDDDGSQLFLETKRSPVLQEPGFFRNEYKTIHVDIGHLDKNIDLARGYRAKLKAGALPALTVLDANGTVTGNTNAAELRNEKEPGLAAVKLAAFLKLHQAPAPNAVALLETAVRRAKNEGKRVFVWFSAPW